MQNLSQTELRSAILAALMAGYLTGPVVFMGESLNAAPGHVETVEHDGNGWILPASPLGGLVSAGVEKLRSRLIIAGYGAVANLLPKYHVGRFWQEPETFFGWGTSDPTRFDPPTKEQNEFYGFDSSQLQQLQDSITAHDNWLFGFIGMAGSTDAFAASYRGQEGIQGTLPHNGLERPSSGWIGSWRRTYARDQEGNIVQNRFRLHKDGASWPDHYLYNLWFDLRTDADITRFWTVWARNFGAPV